MLGVDPNGGSRKFKGWMDEAVVYKKALTQDQIREQMHLIKYPNQPSDSIVAYWQFNGLSSGNTLLNSVQCKYQGIWNSAVAVQTSTGPFGHGSSERISVNSGGNVFLNQADLACGFSTSGTVPGGEIVVSHLRNNPDELPIGTTDYPGNYWIMDNYGAQISFTALDSMLFYKAGQIIGQASDYKLYRRNRNADGAVWGNSVATATSVVNGLNGTLAYTSFTNPITQEGQFVSSGLYYPVQVSEIQESETLAIYPNPANSVVHFQIPKGEVCSFELRNTSGEVMLKKEGLTTSSSVDVSFLTPGIYIYTLKNNRVNKSGTWEKE
jgi:hypothetical protein